MCLLQGYAVEIKIRTRFEQVTIVLIEETSFRESATQSNIFEEEGFKVELTPYKGNEDVSALCTCHGES